MFNTELNTAINLAIAAGEEIMRLHKDGFEVETKKLNHNFTEPVTSADKRANELIVSELKNLFSEDGILSEESEDD
ncbi:MAG: 3'(2'),5'-bisphosphate nucleotidase CysQ, partial [Acidobacteria bacterium]